MQPPSFPRPSAPSRASRYCPAAQSSPSPSPPFSPQRWAPRSSRWSARGRETWSGEIWSFPWKALMEYRRPAPGSRSGATCSTSPWTSPSPGARSYSSGSQPRPISGWSPPSPAPTNDGASPMRKFSRPTRKSSSATSPDTVRAATPTTSGAPRMTSSARVSAA